MNIYLYVLIFRNRNYEKMTRIKIKITTLRNIIHNYIDHNNKSYKICLLCKDAC